MELKYVKIIRVMVIRYRGTSPKLGTSLGWCPYSCSQVSFFGDGGGDEVVSLSFNFRRYSNLWLMLQRLMFCSSNKNNFTIEISILNTNCSKDPQGFNFKWGEIIIKGLKEISLCSFLHGHGFSSFLNMVLCNFFGLLLLDIVLLSWLPLVIDLAVGAFSRRWWHNKLLGMEPWGSHCELHLLEI